MEREIVKASVGFNIQEDSEKMIATGKWGCGAFNGDTYLKFMIQWLAGSFNQRDILFYSFKDQSVN